MEQEKISLSVGYKSEKPIFHLRMISVMEEQEFFQRFSDIADNDTEKAEKTYQILVDGLKAFASDFPQKTEIVEGKETKVLLIEKAVSPSDAIAKYFAKNQWLRKELQTRQF
jgi:hypothetical protein